MELQVLDFSNPQRAESNHQHSGVRHLPQYGRIGFRMQDLEGKYILL